jgi:hypothetical protein
MVEFSMMNYLMINYLPFFKVIRRDEFLELNTRIYSNKHLSNSPIIIGSPYTCLKMVSANSIELILFLGKYRIP